MAAENRRVLASLRVRSGVGFVAVIGLVMCIGVMGLGGLVACAHLKPADPSAAPTPFPAETPPPPARTLDAAPMRDAGTADAALPAAARDGYTRR